MATGSSDVILHLRYTARDGGERMRDSARGQFDKASKSPPITAPSPMVLLSAKDEFPSEWSRARNDNSSLMVRLDSNVLPYWMLKLGLGFFRVSTMDLGGSSADNRERWTRGGTSSTPGLLNLGSGTSDIHNRLIFIVVGL